MRGSAIGVCPTFRKSNLTGTVSGWSDLDLAPARRDCAVLVALVTVRGGATTPLGVTVRVETRLRGADVLFVARGFVFDN